MYACFQYVTNYILVKNLIPTLIIHPISSFIQISSISRFYLQRDLIAWREDDALMIMRVRRTCVYENYFVFSLIFPFFFISEIEKRVN